jgi:two-component system, cell cycle sensor histidine kinase and response regulator CckA
MQLTVDNIRNEGTVTVPSMNRSLVSSKKSDPVNVLAIDDNEQFRNLIKELLKHHGFDVFAIANPLKALDQFSREKDKFQLVLLDFHMPQLDGAKTFEWIKKISPDVKVIIISGGDETRLRQILIKHPIDGYIRKPFRIEEALHVIRHVMSKDTHADPQPAVVC